jgi:integrase
MPRKQQRRANGEGTVIRRKDGRYEAREPKRVDVSGKVSQRSYYGRTVSEALEKRAEAMRQADAGMTMDAQKTTLGEYITQWMDDIGSNDLRANTLRAYRHALSLTAPIQTLPLASINRQTVKGLFARLARQKEPRKVSNAMRRKAHSKLRSVLREAVWDGLIPANPMEKLKAPLPEEKELVIWQEAELLRFLRSVPADTQAHAMFYVLAFTGLRRGELLGLHWSDLKVFEDGQGALSVNRSIVPDKGRGYAEMPPKTKTSRRDVYITHDVVEVIQRQRRRVDALRAECGEMWEGTPAIFPSEVGTYKDPHNAGRLFRIWLKKAVDQDLVPRIRLHDLRHTHASIMIANGHDAKVVSDRLGHANVAFTLKVYRKLFTRERRAAAFGIEDLERADLHAQSVAHGARIAN